MIEKARCLDSAGKTDLCIDFLVNSKEILSGKNFYYYLLGFLYVKKENYVQARSTIEDGIWIDSKSCLLWLLKAFTFLLEENYSEALTLAETTLKLDASYWPADYFIGSLHVIQKNHEDAALHLRRARKFAPDNPDISLSLIHSLYSLKNFDEALNECDNLLKNNEKYAPAWEEKANIYFLMQDWEKALEVCEAGLKNCGDLPALWKYKGGVYDNLTEYRISIECYDKQILCAPDDATAHYGKAIALR